MTENINSFQDLIIEEFETEESVAEDDLEESMDILDIVMTANDEKIADLTETKIDPFLNEIEETVNQIVEEEKERNFDDLMEFFSEDSEVFEEMIDAEIENLEEMQFDPEDGNTIDDDGEIIDFIEGLPDYIEEEE